MKAVGASIGLGAIMKSATAWMGIFATASDEELLPFIRGLLQPPGGVELAEIFAVQALGALGRMILSGSSSSSSSSEALLLLLDYCEALQPGATAGVGVPLLLTAQPGGVALAGHVRGLCRAWSKDGSSSRRELLTCWAGLQLLPHACDGVLQAVEMCEAVLQVTEKAVAEELQLIKQQQQQLGGATAPVTAAATAGGDSRVTLEDLLHVRATAAAMLARLLPAVAPEKLTAVAAAAVEVAMLQPLHYPTLHAAAALLAAVREQSSSKGNSRSKAVADLLATSKFAAAADLLLPALTAPSQQLRGAALQLLTSFDQPAFVTAPVTADMGTLTSSSTGQTTSQTPVFAGMTCDMLLLLRQMHTEKCSLEHGRSWAVAVQRLQNHVEYGRVPDVLLPAVVAGLLGVLYIR
jgi:U3 small nucleolar RNA-associated protein 20